MIKQWGVKNFKSILEADLELAPLTVFTGVNSSGKSAFLHSIVMLTQAIKKKVNIIDKEEIEVMQIYEIMKTKSQDAKGEQKDIDERIPLKGDLLDLGSIDRIYNPTDFINNSDIESESQFVVYENEHPFWRKINIKFSIKYLESSEHLTLQLSGKQGDEKLTVLKAFLEHKDTNQNGSISCKENDYSFNDTTKSASDSYNEMWRKTVGFYSDGALDIFGQAIEVDIRRVLFNSFIPRGIKYFSCNLDSASMKKLIPVFIGLLSDIPVKQLTTKNDAVKYAEERYKMIYDRFKTGMKIEEILKNKESGFGIEEYEFIKYLFFHCCINPWWTLHSENDNSTAIFTKIPFYEKLFSGYKKSSPNGSEYFDIELSDWYQVLSKQDSDIQDAIKSELKNDTGFSDVLVKNMDTFKEYLGNKILIVIPNKAMEASWSLDDYFENRIKYLGPLQR